MNLEQEAVRIAGELGRVAFIGGLAVNHYSPYRATMDIDLAMAGPIDEPELLRLSYRKKSGTRSSWYSPRGVQVDIYTKDVGRIPVAEILATAVEARVGGKVVRIISIECLLIAKHRAARTQDVADLRNLLVNSSRKIDWEALKRVGTEAEVNEFLALSGALRK